MKKRGSGFLMVVSGLLVFYFYYCFNIGGFGQSNVIATVNDTNITLNQLKQFSINSFGSFEEDQSRELLEMMINQEILLIHAERSGIAKNILQPKFDKQERYAKERLMLEMFFDIDAELNINVSKKDIEDYYNSQGLFILRGISFFYSDDEAEEKIRLVSRELNRLGNFNDVYQMFFPNKRISRPGFVGIVNFFNPPDYLIDFIEQLNRVGSATEPIENIFGYVVYFRDEKPSLNEARDFIVSELSDLKSESRILERYNEVVRNNRLNMFIIEGIYEQGFATNNNEALASNRLTNDLLTIGEFMERLADLYNIYTLNHLSMQEFLDYINLFISQKATLSLAHENNYFTNRQFLIRWSQELISLQENQKQETINYMLEYIYDAQSRNISDAEINRYYQRNRNLFRRSDFFKLQTIILNDRASANMAFEEAQTNPDFTSLVMIYSNDPFVNTTRGISPFIDRADLENSYDILYGSRIGDITPPIEVEPNVWHIYKVLDRVQGAVRPVDEVVSQVMTNLMFERMQEYLNELVHTYTIRIEIFEDRLPYIVLNY